MACASRIREAVAGAVGLKVYVSDEVTGKNFGHLRTR